MDCHVVEVLLKLLFSGVLDPELYAGGCAETDAVTDCDSPTLAGDRLAVDLGAVGAVEISDEVLPVWGDGKLSMLARDALVIEKQVGIPAASEDVFTGL